MVLFQIRIEGDFGWSRCRVGFFILFESGAQFVDAPVEVLLLAGDPRDVTEQNQEECGIGAD